MKSFNPHPVEEVFLTDFGKIQVSAGMMQAVTDAANNVQETLWRLVGDELVGIPEAEPFSDEACRAINMRAHDAWCRGEDIEGKDLFQ